MAYKDEWLIANDSDFWHAVAIAAVDVCRDVAQEATSVANHANRVILMRQVLADPDTWARRMAYGVAMLGGTTNPVTADAQLKTWVGQVFNAYAGVA